LNFLLILLGERGKYKQNARYCRFHQLQPDLWIKGNKPRWLLNNKQQTKFDLFHISIMIPTSYKMSFQFAMPMKYTSYLKTMDKIKLFTTPMLSLARSLCACLQELMHTFSVNQLILAKTRQPLQLTWHIHTILNGHSILRYEHQYVSSTPSSMIY